MANLPPANILLVDDSPANLTLLIATLKPLGQNLVTALSGEEALQHLLQQEFAVVLLDIQMPQMNGFEVARLIRSQGINEHIPLIFLTGIERDFSHIRQGYSLGAVDYLLKPIMPEIILSKVSVFVELFQKTAMIKQQAEQLVVTNLHLQQQIMERQLALQTLQQAQIQLQKSEAALAAAQRIAHVGNWELNIVTKKFTWSAELFRIFGLNIDGLAPTYTEFFNYVHPDDRVALQTQFTQAIAQNTPFNAEYRIVLPDNSWRYLESRAEITDETAYQVCLNEAQQEINPESDKPMRMWGVVIDVTKQMQFERELAHKQQLLDAFIKSAPVGITVLDQELRFSLINQALADINGMSAAEHIGKTLWEIVPHLAPQQEQLLRHVLTTGESILDFEVTGETLKLPGVIRTWLASYFPICSEIAKPIGIGIVVVEITERQRAEQMLELQAIITRNMAEGLCLVRAHDNVIVYTNPKFEQMFGYDTGELIGQNVSIINYADGKTTNEAVAQAIKTLVLKDGAATYEVQNVKKDGTPFWCRANTSVFQHPEYGTVFVAVQQDITEQKQAQEKITASLKEKEVLLKEIHHRVKNNLGIVSSLLQMQCRRTQDPQSTAILQDSQNRIASIALVHEKLYRSHDLSNIDFTQYIPDLTRHLFDSYNVSSQQIKLHLQVENVNLDIETAIPCGLIINELVSNALKYAFAERIEGEIMVNLYQKNEQYLKLIVQDNGVGLPPDFDIKKTKTLGINLVQGLVKQLQGSMEINSQQGTRFEMNLTMGNG